LILTVRSKINGPNLIILVGPLHHIGKDAPLILDPTILAEKDPLWAPKKGSEDLGPSAYVVLFADLLGIEKEGPLWSTALGLTF
jgi:hypothetical protein